jgi:hypothetical protein
VVAGVDKKLRVVASDVTPDIGVVPSVSGVCCRSRSANRSVREDTIAFRVA